MNESSAVSLVIPLQDEEATVIPLLRSVGKQHRWPEEIVLVDAGSQDSTVERALNVELAIPVRVVRLARAFPGVARNEGVTAARFEWIAFTDGGIVLDANWLRELRGAAHEDSDVVFGGMEPVCDSLFRECAALAYVPGRRPDATRGPSVASCLIRRSVFLSVGGFPPFRAAEDLIFIERLGTAGARQAFAPEAKIWWQIAGTLGATFDRFACYSQHNLVAGRGRNWHLGVARLYGLLGLIVAAILWGGAGVWTWMALPLFFVIRAAKAAWVKRRSFEFSVFHPARVLGAAGILAVVDVATAVGGVRWLRAKIRN